LFGTHADHDHEADCQTRPCRRRSGVEHCAPVAAGPFEDGLVAADNGDYATAIRLWRPLAEQGNAAAQFNLGLIYYKGQGVPQDYAAAAVWLRKAADQGVTAAQWSIGSMYMNGRGVRQDYAAAVSWYRKAADKGDASAQSNLGVMYAEGHGVPQDYVRAHMWFNLAAAKGNKAAETGRDMTAAKMTPAQIAEAQKLAREWKPK
jgi:TPR repeat protein